MTAARTSPTRSDDSGGPDGPRDAGDPRDPGDRSVDGRRLRRDRNRDAVVDALLALYGDGNLDPSSAEIAERAGLSPRSLFRYFDDIDDLCRAAIAEQQRRVEHLFTVDVADGADLETRIAALVEQRVSLFEAITPGASVMRLRAPFQPILTDELAHSRSMLRKQVRTLLADELADLDADAATALASAADVLCSFEAHQLMRHAQGHSRARTVAVLTDGLHHLVRGALGR